MKTKSSQIGEKNGREGEVTSRQTRKKASQPSVSVAEKPPRIEGKKLNKKAGRRGKDGEIGERVRD